MTLPAFHAVLWFGNIDLFVEELSTKQKEELKPAGLGEKRISISILDMGPEGLTQILLSAFPKLEEGGDLNCASIS